MNFFGAAVGLLRAVQDHVRKGKEWKEEEGRREERKGEERGRGKKSYGKGKLKGGKEEGIPHDSYTLHAEHLSEGM